MGSLQITELLEPPWNLLFYGGAILMVLVPFLLYPFAKTLFLAST